MTPSATSEFGLSRSRDEIYCDWDGAFIASVPLLQKYITDGGQIFEARDLNSLSGEIADRFELPIELSLKAKGLSAIACALNERNLARAQLLTIFLRFPTPPISSGHGISKAAATTFVNALRANGLLKTWEPDLHPRWPAHAPDSQGGQFAPKDSGTQIADADVGPEDEETEA